MNYSVIVNYTEQYQCNNWSQWRNGISCSDPSGFVYVLKYVNGGQNIALSLFRPLTARYKDRWESMLRERKEISTGYVMGQEICE